MTKKRGRGRPKIGNIRVNVMFEPDIHAMLMKRANKENRPFSNMLNVVVREAFIIADTPDTSKAA